MRSRPVPGLEEFLSYAMPSFPERELPDFSRLIIRDIEEKSFKKRRNTLVGNRLSFRVPAEIRFAKSLTIACTNEGCQRDRHEHLLISINEVKLCPVSAMLFLCAMKNYRWSDRLKAALEKIMEVSRIES